MKAEEAHYNSQDPTISFCLIYDWKYACHLCLFHIWTPWHRYSTPTWLQKRNTILNHRFHSFTGMNWLDTPPEVEAYVWKLGKMVRIDDANGRFSCFVGDSRIGDYEILYEIFLIDVLATRRSFCLARGQEGQFNTQIQFLYISGRMWQPKRNLRSTKHLKDKTQAREDFMIFFT